MRLRKPRLFTALVAVALFGGFGDHAWAQTQTGMPAPPGKLPSPAAAMMDSLDTNKDGKVSEDEFLAPQERRFRELDTNNDYMLTREELEKMGVPPGMGSAPQLPPGMTPPPGMQPPTGR